MQRHPPQNLPNQPVQGYGAGDNVSRRRPPINASGHAYHDPNVGNVGVVIGDHPPQTVAMTGQPANYSYPTFHAAPTSQQPHFQVYGQNFPGQAPRYLQTNVDPSRSGANRRSPDSFNQPLAENAVENQQSLQMPATLHSIPPQATSQTWESHGQRQDVGGQAMHPSQGVNSGSEVDPATTITVTREAPVSAAKIVMNTASKLGAGEDQKGKITAAKLLSGVKKPAAGQTKPWVQFTGPEKIDPIFCSWMTTRQVLSGDMFRLASIKPPKQSFAPSKIIVFSLEGIRAPRIGRGDKSDEPFAYEAREFVRKHLCTGAPVLCVAWSVIKGTSEQHFCGDIYIAKKSKNSNEPSVQRESLSHLLVSSGYADLNLKDKKLSPVEQERLSKSLEKAKKSGLGKFVDSAEEEKKNTANSNNALGTENAKQKKGEKAQEHVRQLVQARTPEERKKLADKYMNKTISAVVDQVWSGSILRLELIPDKKSWTHEIAVVNLAGCTAPRSQAPQNEDNSGKNTKRKGGDNGKNVPRWSNEAKEFTEERLLSQRVTVKFVATDPKSNIYAVVSHPKGQIALSLLRAGLAEYESWTAQLLSNKEQKEMKEALKSAQEKRIHIWQDKPANISHDFVSATITQVISGDTFMAQLPGGIEERFTLSSVRQPRFKEANKDSTKGPPSQNQNTKDKAPKDETAQASSQYTEHPWARAAKEFLRKKLIGKKVQLLCDYEKEWKNPADTQTDSRVQKCATVLVNKENVAVELVNAGLAEVIPHRSGDPKSVAYLELQKAQEKAKKTKKGIHGKDVPEEVVDYSLSFGGVALNVMTQLQNFLKNHKRKGVVEYVFSGFRLKVYLPEMNCILPVSLQHIQCDGYHATNPKLQTKAGADAYKYIKQRLSQRDIEIEVTGKIAQKNGTPIWTGKVWINGKDVALELLEQGLARIFVPSPPFNRGPRRPNASDIPSEYTEAELAAKEKKIGRWEEIAAKRQEWEEKKKKNDMTGHEKTVTVCHVDSAVQFWVNVSESNQLEKLEAEMARVPSQNPGKIRVAKIVAALYDGLYCRARVTKGNQHDPSLWLVHFVDYGNRAWISQKNMASLPQTLSLGKWPALAHSCQLAALRAPSRNSSYFNISGQKFADLTLPSPNSGHEKPLVKELKIKIVWDDFGSRKWHVVLLDQNTNINEYMVKNGYARFDQKSKETPQELESLEDAFTKDYLKIVQKLNDDALQARIGLWEIGDASTDEEDLF